MSKKENNKYESLFEPLKIGGVIVKNRFFMSPMGNFGHVDAEGALTDEGIDYYVERAKGGIGLIISLQDIVLLMRRSKRRKRRLSLLLRRIL